MAAELRMEPVDGIELLTQVRSIVPTAVRIGLHERGGRSLRRGAPRRGARAHRLRADRAHGTRRRGLLHRPDREPRGPGRGSRRPEVDADRIIGDPSAADVRSMTETLRRHWVPVGVYPTDSDEGRRIIDRAGHDAPLPLVEVLERCHRGDACGRPACGATDHRRGVPAIEDLLGAGVFYGFTTGAAQALDGLDAFVVGAGNSAGQAALHIARSAARVTLLARGPSLERSMSDYLVREIAADHAVA